MMPITFMHGALILAWIGLFSPLLAQQDGAETLPGPELFVTVDPGDIVKNGGYLHGQIVVRVLLMSPYPYEALNLIVPDIDGAKKVELQSPRSRQVESYAGSRFVLETVFALYPMHRGLLRIAPIQANGIVDINGRDTDFAVANAEIEVSVAGVDPSFSDPWWLVAESVEITEMWSKPLDELRAGDAVRRDIRVVAKGTTVEHLPTLEHGKTGGVSATLVDHSSETQTTSSGAIATLNQSWILKFQPQDISYIAPLGIAYWDQKQRVRKKASIPGRRLELLSEDPASLAEQLMAEAQAENHRSRVLALILAMISLLPMLGLVFSMVFFALPTFADLRLAILLSRTGVRPANNQSLYRAANAWARSSGFDFDCGLKQSEYPREIRKLQSALFAAADPSGGTGASIRCLLRYSRRRRLSRLSNRLGVFQSRFNSLWSA